MSRYRKAIVAVLTGIATGVATYTDAPEWLVIAGVIANAVLVYFVPNEPPNGS